MCPSISQIVKGHRKFIYSTAHLSSRRLLATLNNLLLPPNLHVMDLELDSGPNPQGPNASECYSRLNRRHLALQWHWPTVRQFRMGWGGAGTGWDRGESDQHLGEGFGTAVASTVGSFGPPHTGQLEWGSTPLCGGDSSPRV